MSSDSDLTGGQDTGPGGAGGQTYQGSGAGGEWIN